MLFRSPALPGRGRLLLARAPGPRRCDAQWGDQQGPLRHRRSCSLRLGLGCGVGARLRRLLLRRLGGGRLPCLRLPRLPLLPHLPRVPFRCCLKVGSGVHATSGAPRSPRRLNDGGGSRPLERQWSSGCLEKKTRIQEPPEKRKKQEYTKEFELTPTPSVVASPSCGSEPPSRPPPPAWSPPPRPWASSSDCRTNPARHDAFARRPEQAAQQRNPRHGQTPADGVG